LHVAQAGFTPDPTSEREDERNTQQADPVALGAGAGAARPSYNEPRGLPKRVRP
jgi:hypothetical protein